MTYKVGFVGLGKLGMPCAESMQQIYNVTGYDIYPKESGVIDIVDSIKETVTGKDLIFVAVQTPHEKEYDGSQPTAHLENKDFDYSLVKEVLTEINQYTNKDTLIVLISTVLPGTVRREFAPIVTNARFIYNPYLIAMGSVAWDMVNPEMLIIGTENGETDNDANILQEFYMPLMENNPRTVIGTWEEAECIKIFHNITVNFMI
mgnify:FL=1